MAIYNAFLDRETKIRQKMRIDLIDKKGLMTIIVVVPSDLIENHNQKIFPGKGIMITNIQIVTKRNYDRGDCDHSLLENISMIENINVVCA